MIRAIDSAIGLVQLEDASGDRRRHRAQVRPCDFGNGDRGEAGEVGVVGLGLREDRGTDAVDP